MTFSTGFTTEANKSHGQALSVRMFTRPMGYRGITNFYDYSKDRFAYSGDMNYQATATTVSTPVSPTGELTRKLEIGEYGLEIYNPDPSAFEHYEKLLFSVYIHTDTTDNSGYSDGRLQIYNHTTSSVVSFNYSSTAGAIVGYPGGSPVTGVTEIGSGWYRVYMGINLTGTSSPTDEYSFILQPPGEPVGVAQMIYSSPMIEVDVETPSEYFSSDGSVVYPGDLQTASTYDRTIRMNPITWKREREFGVVQGQQTQIAVTNEGGDRLDYFPTDAMCCVQVGFENLEEWETVVQGRLKNVEVTDGVTAIVTIDDAVMSLLDKSIPYDMTFQSTSWAGNIEKFDVSSSSNSYDNDTYPITVSSSESTWVEDTFYIIEFQSATTFKVKNADGLYLQDGTQNYVDGGSAYTISSNAEFSPKQSSNIDENVFTIDYHGWSTGASAYVTGDEFRFFTSAARTSDELTPIGMVKHLIEDVGNIQVFDVITGDYYSSPLYDIDNWTGKVADSSGPIGGYWKAGTKLIQMIQDALKFEHASVFPSNTGQIAIWVQDAVGADSVTINGDLGIGDINLLGGSFKDNSDEYYNVATVKYKDLDTGEDTSITEEAATKNRPPKELTITNGWGAAGAIAKSCATKALIRFGEDKREFKLNTTLALLPKDISEPVVVYDPMMGVQGDKASIAEKALDVENQIVSLVVYNEPLTELLRARVGEARIGSTDKGVW